MNYTDLFYLVRCFDDVLEDWNEYRFEHEDSAIAWFRHCYDLGMVVSLRKVQIAQPFSNDLGDIKPQWIKLDPPIYENKKENEK